MKNYLICIGINIYESTFINNLSNAVKDCKDLVSVLSSKYNFNTLNTKELYDQAATGRNIHDLFRDVSSIIMEEDSLIIYYAGHGVLDAKVDKGYWIPYDAQIDNYSSYFSNNDLIGYIQGLKVKHILLISDSCFSRSILLQSETRSIGDYELQKSRWALTSGRKEVSDGDPGTNSPFATAIYEFLYSRDDDFLTSDLIQYVKNEIAKKYDQNPQGYPLSNVGHEGGEFIFKPIKRIRALSVDVDDFKGYNDIAKILHLYEPRSIFQSLKQYEDKASKIGYNLFMRNNKALNKTEYYLYLYSGINQNSTLSYIKKKHPEIFRDKHFVILIPKEEGQKKIEIRKKNILEKFRATTIFYIDEFIWDLCTPSNFTQKIDDDKFLDINNFVTPKIQDELGKEVEFTSLIDWLSLKNEQVLVIKGSGGIGKTTIAKNISDIFQEQKDLSNKDRKTLFIESTEIIDELKRVQRQGIKLNLYSFYEADYLRNTPSHEKLNNDLFKVNLDNGNILIVIDGLDEVISKVPNFDINDFMRSIFELYNEIGNGKIIITCRNHFWDKSRFENHYFIKTIELLPFNEALARQFFDISFNGDSKKIIKGLSLANEFTARGKDQTNDAIIEYQPYVLDIIKNVIESKYELLKETNLFDSILLLPSIKSDYIIYNVCYRETKRIDQVTVDMQVQIFIYLAVYHDGIIAETKLEELIENAIKGTVDSTKIEAFKSHPFIITHKNKVQFKYDFLIDVFKSLFIKGLIDINSSIEITKEVICIFSNNCLLNSSLISEVMIRIEKWTDEELLKISDLIEYIYNNEEIKLSTRQKTISGLLALSLRINHKFESNNIAQNTQLIDKLFVKNNMIERMSIINYSSYKEVIKFDFTNKILNNCYFDNYSDFWSCKFDNKTHFNECTLYNLSNEEGIPVIISENQFRNCTKDTSFNYIFKDLAIKEKDANAKVKVFMESFFTLFLTRGKVERQSYNNIIRRRYSGIKPQLIKLDELINVLKSYSIISTFEEYGETKVRIEPEYKMDITKFCKEGLISSKIKDIILLVKNKM